MIHTDPAPTAQAKLLAIKTALAATANWRDSRGKKYPDDIRNEHAARLLRSLIGETPSLPDHLVAELSACPNLGQAASDTARRVGFSLFPASLIEFLHAILLHAAEQGGVR